MSIYGNTQMGLGNVFAAAASTTDEKFKLGQYPEVGQRVRFDDGRVFRFCKAGDTITRGAVLAATPNVQAIAATYFGADASTAPIVGEGGAIGDKIVRLADNVSGVTADEYAGGYLVITDFTGEGTLYRIKKNAATGSAGTGFLVYLYDGLIVALNNTSVGLMINNSWDGVVVHTAADYGGTATQFICGVANVAATVGQYFWCQTWGPAAVKAGTGTIVAGSPVQCAESLAGSGQTPVSGENRIQIIGSAMYGAADTIWAPVFLQICP